MYGIINKLLRKQEHSAQKTIQLLFRHFVGGSERLTFKRHNLRKVVSDCVIAQLSNGANVTYFYWLTMSSPSCAMKTMQHLYTQRMTQDDQLKGIPVIKT